MYLRSRSIRAALTALFVIAVIGAWPAIAVAADVYNYAWTVQHSGWGTLSTGNTNMERCRNAMQAQGLSVASYIGTAFYQTRVLNNVPVGNVFYAFTHGGPESFVDDYGPAYITHSEIAAARGSDWKKFVWIDACSSLPDGDTRWPAQWGINGGDGYFHTYLGWNSTMWDVYNPNNGEDYSKFRSLLWEKLGQGYTLHNAIQYARDHGADNSNIRSIGDTRWHF